MSLSNNGTPKHQNIVSPLPITVLLLISGLTELTTVSKNGSEGTGMPHVYLRASHSYSTIRLRWADSTGDRCNIYNIAHQQSDSGIHHAVRRFS